MLTCCRGEQNGTLPPRDFWAPQASAPRVQSSQEGACLPGDTQPGLIEWSPPKRANFAVVCSSLSETSSGLNPEPEGGSCYSFPSGSEVTRDVICKREHPTGIE